MSVRQEKRGLGKYFLQLVFGCLAIALAGCGGARPAATPSQTPPATSSAPATSSEPAASGQAQLSWYLSALAGKEGIDDPALQQHFAPEFLAKIPPATFRSFTEKLRSTVQRLELVRMEPTNSSERVHAVTRAPTGAVFHVLLAVEPEAPHRVSWSGRTRSPPRRRPLRESLAVGSAYVSSLERDRCL